MHMQTPVCIARLYYVSLNYQKLPMGYTFDNLSLVFNRTYAENLTLVAPTDTGHWLQCAKKKKHHTDLNCSGWDLNVVRSPPPPSIQTLSLHVLPNGMHTENMHQKIKQKKNHTYLFFCVV